SPRPTTTTRTGGGYEHPPHGPARRRRPGRHPHPQRKDIRRRPGRRAVPEPGQRPPGPRLHRGAAPPGQRGRAMKTRSKDYYALLGVEPGATTAQIKSAYRKLAKQYHPDLNSSPDAAGKFREITEAYDTLTDPDRR